MNVLHMGGYAAWVWPAYGLALAGLAGILIVTLRDLKTRQREFENLKNLRRGSDDGAAS